MSIFDVFNTNAQTGAANAIGAGVQQGEAQALPYYQAGLGNIGQGIGALGQGIGTLQGGIGAIQNQALPTVAGTTATGAAPSWTNFANAQPGVGMYGNALGLNGPAGSQQAYNAFRGSGGYQASLGGALAADAAAQAAMGGTGSGNAILSAQRAAQNTASQGWQNYLSSLSPYLNMSQNAANTLAGTYGTLGGQQTSLYGQQTGLTGQQGSMFGNIANQYNAMNAANQNIGNMYYGGAATAATANAQAQLAALNASANTVNAGIGGIGALAGGLLAFSDIKLKEDVAPVGALASGETVYRYRYKGEPGFQIGLIAQEVESTTPEAVVEVLPDLRAVDYRRATERAAKIVEQSQYRSIEPPPTYRPFAHELMELAA